MSHPQDQYSPHVSRWLLLAGGTILAYSVAFAAARLLLGLLEVGAAWLDVDAGEALYFLLGVEHPLKYVMYCTALYCTVLCCTVMIGR